MKLLFSAALLAALSLATAQAQTLRWASQGDAQTMDPHSQNESMTNAMNGQVYEALVNYDKKLGMDTILAASYQMVSPTLWRFKLRPNVKFHTGRPFGAKDVKASFEALLAPGSKAGLQLQYLQRIVGAKNQHAVAYYVC